MNIKTKQYTYIQICLSFTFLDTKTHIEAIHQNKGEGEIKITQDEIHILHVLYLNTIKFDFYTHCVLLNNSLYEVLNLSAYLNSYNTVQSLTFFS